jgi:hypothetical protein
LLTLISRLRSRQVAALVVAVAVAMQVFVAGLAAEIMPAQTPGVSDFAVICHGAGAAGQDDGTLPEPSGAKHPCCVFCTAAAPALAEPPNALRPWSGRVFKAPMPEERTILIAWRAVRAGLSQAPPKPDWT